MYKTDDLLAKIQNTFGVWYAFKWTVFIEKEMKFKEPLFYYSTNICLVIKSRGKDQQALPTA